MTQVEIVLRALKAGERLNPDDARKKYGIQRLAARVWDLRKTGYKIAEKMVRTPSGDGGECIATEYYLLKQ